MRAPRGDASGTLLRTSLLAGSAYDVVFGVGILAAPAWLAVPLGIPMPADEIYLRFIGVFLLALGALYLLPALDPARYLGVAILAAPVRLMGMAFLLTAALAFDRPRAFLWLGLADGAFAAAHLLGLAAWRRGTRVTDASPRATGR